MDRVKSDLGRPSIADVLGGLLRMTSQKWVAPWVNRKRNFSISVKDSERFQLHCIGGFGISWRFWGFVSIRNSKSEWLDTEIEIKSSVIIRKKWIITCFYLQSLLKNELPNWVSLLSKAKLRDRLGEPGTGLLGSLSVVGLCPDTVFELNNFFSDSGRLAYDLLLDWFRGIIID